MPENQITPSVTVTLQAGPAGAGSTDDFELFYARRAVDRFRTLLVRQGLLDLLAAEIGEGNAFLCESARTSDGTFGGGTTVLATKGLTSGECPAWMGKAFAGDEKPLLTAHPEHHVMGTDEIGARVVETIGPHVASLHMDGWGTDALDWAKDAAELLPESGILRKMSSNLFLADGTVVGRALIQFGDTADGFTANLTVYVPVSCPDEVLDHHLRHYAVEFMRAWAGTRPNSPRSPTTSPPTAWPWRCSPAPCPMYDPRGPGRLLLAFFAALAENQRENIRESPLEGFDAAARKGKHGGRPPGITEDMLHTVLRRRANGESVERIQPGLIIPTGKRKGQALSVASICRALAKRGQQEAYPEAVAQAHADFADLQDAYGIPGSLAESASGGRTIRSPRRRPERDQSQRHFLYRNYSHPARPVSSVELKLVQRELGGRSVCVDWGYP